MEGSARFRLVSANSLVGRRTSLKVQHSSAAQVPTVSWNLLDAGSCVVSYNGFGTAPIRQR